MYKSTCCLPTIVIVLTQLTGYAAADGIEAPEVPGGSDPLVLPAAAFASDGDTPASYYLEGAYVAGGTNVRLRAPVYLPAGAFISNFIAVTRDENSSVNAHVYLHETPFGVLGEDLVVSHLETSGSSSEIQYPSDYSVDHQTFSGSRMYWVEAVLPGSDIRLYSVHVFFDDDALFVDGFEAGNLARWDGTSALKSGPANARAPVPDMPTPTASTLKKSLGHADSVLLAELDKALKNSAYGSPAVIPGSAFKCTGSIEYDDYYISPSYGFVYARPDERARMVAPVNLPHGAEISWIFLVYRDSNPSSDIDFVFARMNTWDGSRETLLTGATSGATSDIRVQSWEGGNLTTAMIDNSHYSHWFEIEVEGYDFAQDFWHEVHAVMVLYTVP